MDAFITWLLPLGAYLIGSVPFGYLIGRARGIDIRQHGSRNVGATNVARVLGRKLGYLCFALDVLKGLAPVLLTGMWLSFQAGRSAGRTGPGDGATGPSIPTVAQQAAWLVVAFGAIIGHVCPVWLKFRGGKGVATSLGVLLGFYPYFTWAGLAAFGLWLVAAAIWRYVSLASILAVVAFPWLFIAACAVFDWPILRLWPLLAFAAAMACLVVIRHRANIARLRAGTEGRIGGRKVEE